MQRIQKEGEYNVLGVNIQYTTKACKENKNWSRQT
jgi:hypothetical protein